MAYHTMVHQYPEWGKKKDWATPNYFFNLWNDKYKFDLDAAALSHNKKVENYLGPDHPNDKQRDALCVNWNDYANNAIWCNPPYGKHIRDFLIKGEETNLPCVYLLPNSTDTKWFHDIAMKHEIQFVKGRLKFNDGKSPASFGSIVVIINGTKAIQSYFPLEETKIAGAKA